MSKLKELREAIDHHLPPDGGEPQDLDLNTGVWALGRARMLIDIIEALQDPECKAVAEARLAEMLAESGDNV